MRRHITRSDREACLTLSRIRQRRVNARCRKDHTLTRAHLHSKSLFLIRKPALVDLEILELVTEKPRAGIAGTIAVVTTRSRTLPFIVIAMFMRTGKKLHATVLS